MASPRRFSARRINLERGTPGVRVWQRDYYEHIVRSGQSLARIRRYIELNPARWALDANDHHPRCQATGRRPTRLPTA
jgi:REP element-mobilizing transposase RayT